MEGGCKEQVQKGRRRRRVSSSSLPLRQGPPPALCCYRTSTRPCTTKCGAFSAQQHPLLLLAAALRWPAPTRRLGPLPPLLLASGAESLSRTMMSRATD